MRRGLELVTPPNPARRKSPENRMCTGFTSFAPMSEILRVKMARNIGVDWVYQLRVEKREVKEFELLKKWRKGREYLGLRP